VSVNRILTKSFLSDPRRNTIIFFGVSIASVILCCIIFHATRHSTFVRYHVGVCRTAALDEDARAITQQVCNPEEVGLVSFARIHPSDKRLSFPLLILAAICVAIVFALPICR
jgi:hypothetical protein